MYLAATDPPHPARRPHAPHQTVLAALRTADVSSGPARRGGGRSRGLGPQARAYRHPALAAAASEERLTSLPPALADRLRADLTALGVDADSAFYDPRAGRWSSLVLSEPLVPGTGPRNRVAWAGRGATADGRGGVREQGVGGAAAVPASATAGSCGSTWRSWTRAPRIGVFEGGRPDRGVRPPHGGRRAGAGRRPEPRSSTTATWCCWACRTGATWTRRPAPGSRPEAARAVVVDHARPFSGGGRRRASRTWSASRWSCGERYDYRLAWVVKAAMADDLGQLGRARGRPQRRAPRLRGHEPVRGPQGDRRRLPGEQRPGARRTASSSRAGRCPSRTSWWAATRSSPTRAACWAAPRARSPPRLAGRFVRITDACGAINESSAAGDIDLGSGPRARTARCRPATPPATPTRPAPASTS